MKIDVHNIPPEGLELNLKVNPYELDLEDLDSSLNEPVQFRGNLKKSEAGCLVHGSLQGSWILTCGRCLKSYTLPVNESFKLFFVFQCSEPDDNVVALDPGDLDTYEISDDLIDMNLVIREQMILQIPIKPICSDSCQGLCASCGQDLNAGKCECKHESIDPRLIKLKDFFKER